MIPLTAAGIVCPNQVSYAKYNFDVEEWREDLVRL
jgi:hypothetical protein